MTRLMPCRPRRRGVALPTAVIALVLLSALVAGARVVSTEELHAGRGDVADQRALAAAEWALARAIGAWDPQRNTRDTVGRAVIILDEAPAPNERVVVTATRVQRRSVWLSAEAMATGDGRAARARHAIAVSLRLAGVSVAEQAALTALGGVTVDRGIIDGRDAGGSSDASGVCADDERADAAGIAVPDVSRVTCVDCASFSGGGVFGNPPIDSSVPPPGDSAAAGARAAWRGALDARATIDIAGGTLSTRPAVVNGECDRTDPLDWGDPSGATSCADYYPVIHVRGNATVAAGSVGQGVLLVDGTLRIEPSARFEGVVVVSGDVLVAGTGAEIVGVVVAADGGGAGTSLVSDGGAIRFGRCAVRRAVLGSARLERTPVRWWTELR
jgi:hypothetical protein